MLAAEDPSVLSPVIALGLMVALAVWAAIWLTRPRRRGDLYRRLASELGLRYAEPVTADITTEEVREGWGTGVAVERQIAGSLRGYEVVICDQIVSQALCSASRVSQTVIRIGRAGLVTPEFILQPRNWFTRKAEIIDGEPNIWIEGDPDFTRSNYLKGSDAEEVRELFTTRARELLRGNDGLMIQGQGTGYLFYRHGELLAYRAIRGLLDESIEILRAFHPEDREPG
ncbi:MAG: hypothetical protein ACYSU0_21740 [Planctomycetota bacterium]